MCNKVVPPRAFSGSRALQNSYGVLAPGGALFSINPRANSDGVVLFGGSNPAQGKLKEYLSEGGEEGKRWYDDSLSNFEPVTRAVEDFTTAEFEGWVVEEGPGQGCVYAWSGIIGLSADTIPFVGPVPSHPGQWLCAGFHGHGMARVFTCAPGLVTLMRGGTWADTGLPEVFELTEGRLTRIDRDRGKAFTKTVF